MHNIQSSPVLNATRELSVTIQCRDNGCPPMCHPRREWYVVIRCNVHDSNLTNEVKLRKVTDGRNWLWMREVGEMNWNLTKEYLYHQCLISLKILYMSITCHFILIENKRRPLANGNIVSRLYSANMYSACVSVDRRRVLQRPQRTQLRIWVATSTSVQRLQSYNIFLYIDYPNWVQCCW